MSADLESANPVRANLFRADLMGADSAVRSSPGLTSARLIFLGLTLLGQIFPVQTSQQSESHPGRVGTGKRRREHPTTCRAQPPCTLGREECRTGQRGLIALTNFGEFPFHVLG